MNKLSTHLTDAGEAHMVDVGDKQSTKRKAVAEAVIRVSPALMKMIVSARIPKGDVIAAARIAGIQAAKRTSELIPLCHPIPITHVSIEIETDESASLIRITSAVETTWVTGVEMEALTAVSVAALTIYDMVKSVEKGVIIE